MSPTPPSCRLIYIDWMRGLACVTMFQTHCYDAWLTPELRKSRFFMWSQLGGTLPAPIFLFLAGVSLALLTDKLLRKNLSANQIGSITIKRGAEIFGLGLLFRLQEYLISWGWAPWSDLFRVDILNTIGVSMMLMGALSWMVLTVGSRWTAQRRTVVLIAKASAVALAISLLTPIVWTNGKLNKLPWPLESYLNGVHNLGHPQSGLFPLFPWAGFAFAGLAVGFFLFSDWGRDRVAQTFAVLGLGGMGLIGFSRWLDTQPQVYAVDNYWQTSPSFFLLRVGLLLIILTLAYAWCRWGAGAIGFSPLAQLGQTSLLVYWVHIEFVYGKPSILPHRTSDLKTASWGLLIIFLSMLLLSIGRTSLKRRSAVRPAVSEALSLADLRHD